MTQTFEICAEDFDRIVAERDNPPAMTPMMIEANRCYLKLLSKRTPTPAGSPATPPEK